MDPFIPRHPAEDTARQPEAERYVCTAKNLLLSGKTERNVESCWQLVIKALSIDPCAPGGNALLVAATALRATNYRYLLPSGIDPYAVLGLLPEVPTARDPAVIESYYRQASGLLGRCHPVDPCALVFAEAAGLVADAWAVLSDPQRKASLDSRFEAAPQLMPPPTPPRQPPPTQAGPNDVGRGTRTKKPTKTMNL